jgi:hypothetical protein
MTIGYAFGGSLREITAVERAVVALPAGHRDRAL